MKVALISPEERPVPPIEGGAVEQILYETALNTRGPELFIISPQPNKPISLSPKEKQLFYHIDIQTQKRRVDRLLAGQPPQGLRDAKSAKWFYYLHGVADLIETLNPDVIEIHNRPHFAAYMCRQFPNKQIVFFMHSDKFSKFDHQDLSHSQIDQLVFVSDEFRQRFLKKQPQCKSKSTVIYNAVNIQRWNPKLKTDPQTEAIRSRYQLPRGQTLLFIGRIVEQKGIHLLTKAIKHLKQKLPHVKLMVVGSPEFKSKSESHFFSTLKRHTRTIKENIIFTNYVNRDETPYYYATADLVIMPSLHTEGMPLVALEAGAMGIPLIGSRCGGIPEIVQHKINGLLIDDPENTNYMASQILALLSNPTQLHKMAKAARNIVVSHFSQPIRQSNIQAYYSSLESKIKNTALI